MELDNTLTPDQVKQYMTAGDYNQAIGVNHYKWTTSELFTFGASTCLVPIVVNEDFEILGMGHFVVSSPFLRPGGPTLHQERFSLYVMEASLMVSEAGNTQMYLFGGTDGNPEYLQRSRNEAIKRFSTRGIECTDLTPTEPQLVLELIITNLHTRTIQYHYGPAKS